MRPRGPDISDTVAFSGASVSWHLEDGVHHDVFLYPWWGGFCIPMPPLGGQQILSTRDADSLRGCAGRWDLGTPPR